MANLYTSTKIQTLRYFTESDTWSRIEDLLDLCLWRRSTRPAIISLGTMSRSLKNSAKRLATSEYASCKGDIRTCWHGDKERAELQMVCHKIDANILKLSGPLLVVLCLVSAAHLETHPVN